MQSLQHKDITVPRSKPATELVGAQNVTVPKQTSAVLTAWATRDPSTQRTAWKRASAAERGALRSDLQLPQEKEPEVKAGLDLKLANSLLVEISKFHPVLCHSKQDGKGRVLLGSKSPYP